LTLRYNPHSIEKQARKWPVLLCQTELYADVHFRIEQIWGEKPSGWLDAFACRSAIAGDLSAEFGVDACRIASVSADNTPAAAEKLLEPSFKWLAKIFGQFTGSSSDFSPVPWLEAAFIGRDLALQQKKYRTALTLVRKAARLSPPGNSLSSAEHALVTACLYPFAPLLATHLAAQKQSGIADLPTLADHFPELVCVRFALENGGWHQKVFDRASFANDPLQQLMQVKLVRKAVGSRSARISSSKQGLRICLC